jgi:hypothetical protein
MSSKLWISALLMAAVGMAADTSSSPAADVTFNRDVLPVLQRNCQGCHRPGQVAPMSFLTYQSVRPWAKAMKTAVIARKMPPWFADPQYGPYSNDHSLTQNEIGLIAKWADSGAPEGDAKDAPAPVRWTEGWLIQPDIIIDGPTTNIPAHPKNNVVEWRTVTMPTGFTKDTWITSLQIKPEFPAVTHHICSAFIPHVPNTKYGVAYWQDKPRDENGSALPDQGPTFGGRGKQVDAEGNPPPPGAPSGAAEDCYLPGNAAADYRVNHAAKLVPAGYDMVFNLHYTPNGTAVTDHVTVGFTVADKAPDRRYVSLSTTAPPDPKKFAIPPNVSDWQSPPAEAVFLEDAELVYMMPHMHFRGKDMTYVLEFPDGRKQTVLSVPHYDFNWQLGYWTSIKVPKGTKLHVDAHYDNSVNNKFNPDPNKTVYYGEMTWEEMMFPFFGVVVDKNTDPKKIIKAGAQFAGGGG